MAPLSRSLLVYIRSFLIDGADPFARKITPFLHHGAAMVTLLEDKSGDLTFHFPNLLLLNVELSKSKFSEIDEQIQ